MLFAFWTKFSFRAATCLFQPPLLITSFFSASIKRIVKIYSESLILNKLFSKPFSRKLRFSHCLQFSDVLSMEGVTWTQKHKNSYTKNVNIVGCVNVYLSLPVIKFFAFSSLVNGWSSTLQFMFVCSEITQ